MNSPERSPATTALASLWRTSRPLTAVGLVMLAACLASLVGIALDRRMILNAPAWLKPAKFALSTAVYSLTLAWVFGYLPAWPRTRMVVGWTTAVVFVLEVAIIDLQAWRGTTSHFNVGTPFDAALFSVMGLGIAAQTLASGAVAVALWKQHLADPVLGTALRAGMIITIVGASTGGLMTVPTTAQVEVARTTGVLVTAGSHTVGGPDGGPGLPGTGWSTTHGDIRVAHFLGLHAMQALAVVALVLRRVRIAASASRLMRVAAASYAGLFAVLLVQAVQGEPLVAPGPLTLVLLGVWGVATTAGAWIAGRRAVTRAGVVVEV